MSMKILRNLIKTMRPKQWTKNVVIFAALIFDRQLTHLSSLEHTIAGFLIFCLITSSVYILNDLVDIEADRAHPQKCKRPLASGALPKSIAVIAGIVFLVVAFPLAFLLSRGFAIICGIYFLLNVAYSLKLKHIPLVDVLIIAAGFVLRVGGGVELIHVERFSPWLYVVTTLLALYLGFGKRRAEISLLAENANTHRKVLNGYTLPLLDQLITIVSSTTIVAYSLYTFSAPNLPENHTMMLTIPFALYGIFRYLYLIQVEQAGGAPEDLLLTDRPLQIAIILWGAAILLIFYIF